MEKKRSVTPNGDAVRSARLRKAWTSDDLAGHAECDVKTVQNAERGKAIYANTLARIASALEVDYDSLIGRPVERKTPADVELIIPTMAELRTPPFDYRKPGKLHPIISTTRVRTTFGILARENQRIDTKWFLDQLKSHVAFQDVVFVLYNDYARNRFIPEGGVWIGLKMSVGDYEQVYALLSAKRKVDEPFLKIVYAYAASIPNPYLDNDFLWLPPFLWDDPPHSHLYE